MNSDMTRDSARFSLFSTWASDNPYTTPKEIDSKTIVTKYIPHFLMIFSQIGTPKFSHKMSYGSGAGSILQETYFPFLFFRVNFYDFWHSLEQISSWQLSSINRSLA